MAHLLKSRNTDLQAELVSLSLDTLALLAKILPAVLFRRNVSPGLS